MDAKKIREIQQKAREAAAARDRWERSDEGRRQRAKERQEAWVHTGIASAEEAIDKGRNSCHIQIEDTPEGREVREEVAKRLDENGFYVRFYECSRWEDAYYVCLEVFWRPGPYQERMHQEGHARRVFFGLIFFVVILGVLWWMWREVKEKLPNHRF